MPSYFLALRLHEILQSNAIENWTHQRLATEIRFVMTEYEHFNLQVLKEKLQKGQNLQLPALPQQLPPPSFQQQLLRNDMKQPPIKPPRESSLRHWSTFQPITPPKLTTDTTSDDDRKLFMATSAFSKQSPRQTTERYPPADLRFSPYDAPSSISPFSRKTKF